jgi:hypothetical protein
MDDLGYCKRCKRPFMEIDPYGERLVGCIKCNRWGGTGNEQLLMELPEEDIQALRKAAHRHR